MSKRFEEDRYIIRNLAVYDTYKRIFITPKLSTKSECEIIIMHLNYHKDIISTKNNQIDYLYNHYNKIKKENEELKEQKQQYKGQRDYLLFVIERRCSKELFEETKSYLKGDV